MERGSSAGMCRRALFDARPHPRTAGRPRRYRPWPGSTVWLHLATLMSLFQGVRHERSSPDQLGSKYEAEGSRMAGGGAEDDGRANLYGAVCVKRSSLPVRLG